MEYGTLKDPVGLVLDAFRVNFDKKVKAHNANHPLLKWIMMDGGITPNSKYRTSIRYSRRSSDLVLSIESPHVDSILRTSMVWKMVL